MLAITFTISARFLTHSLYRQDLERKEEEFKEAERKRRREEYYR
jgi:hypothetical protein